MRPKTGDICVATVTDAAFVAGTEVMLSSFLRFNEWFTGSIVVLHDGLPEDARRRLSRFPGLRFREVSRELQRRVAEVGAALPRLAHRLRNLYSLEAFDLPEYERVLKFDSDVYCQSDASELLATEGELLACPDLSYYRGQVRDLATYESIARAEVARERPVFDLTFNVGIMVLRPDHLRGCYAELLDQVRPDTWTSISTGHMDSVLLNHRFRDRWTRLPEQYNYLLFGKGSPRRMVPMSRAVFLHFFGSPKPWQDLPKDHVLSQEQQVARKLWRDEWNACRAR